MNKKTIQLNMTLGIPIKPIKSQTIETKKVKVWSMSKDEGNAFMSIETDYDQLITSANVNTFDYILDKFGLGNERVKNTLDRLREWNKRQETGILYSANGSKITTQTKITEKLQDFEMKKLELKQEQEQENVAVETTQVNTPDTTNNEGAQNG